VNIAKKTSFKHKRLSTLTINSLFALA